MSQTPDVNGLVGPNMPTWGNTIYPKFSADNQRFAFYDMMKGILLNDDATVYGGWHAFTTAYAHQTSAGDFGGRGIEDMHFFMAWSNHAISFLLDSPYAHKCPPGSNLTYAELINGSGKGDYGMLPKIQAAMDCMTSQATHDDHDPLRWDYGAPNRTLINANAFAFGYLLLRNYPAAAPKLAGYYREAQWWTNNEFLASKDFPYRPLADAKTGVFYEGNNWNGCGYDTHYGLVGFIFAEYLAYNLPDLFAELRREAPRNS